MHVPHELVHLLDGLRWGFDDDVDPVTEHGELVVGDERRDLDEGIGPQREAGHLAVDPDDPVGEGALVRRIIRRRHRTTIEAQAHRSCTSLPS